jgi:hypothetical protein
MILDGIAGITIYFQGKISHFSAILKPLFFFILLFSITYKKRGSFQTKRTTISKASFTNIICCEC